MKVKTMYIKIFIASLLVITAHALEKPQETELLSKIEKDTRQEALKERDKELRAQQDSEQAKRKAEDYKLEAEKMQKDPQKRDESLKNEILWSTQAKAEQEVAEQAKTEADKLEKKADELAQEQKELAQEFDPADQQKDLLKEKFEKCIKTNINKGIKSKKLSQAEAKKLGEYIKQLTQKVSELTRYETTNFYKSNEIKSDEWKTIHKKALGNPEQADSYYVGLLRSIENLSTLIKGILKAEDLEIPTTTENGVCALKLFKGFEKELKKIQDTVNPSDMSWDN